MLYLISYTLAHIRPRVKVFVYVCVRVCVYVNQPMTILFFFYSSNTTMHEYMCVCARMHTHTNVCVCVCVCVCVWARVRMAGVVIEKKERKPKARHFRGEVGYFDSVRPQIEVDESAPPTPFQFRCFQLFCWRLLMSFNMYLFTGIFWGHFAEGSDHWND